MKEARKYFVKEAWIFNLESMNDKIWNLIYDVEDGVIEFPFEVAGTVMRSVKDLYALKDECGDLEFIAKFRKVTSSEYGRIKEIVNWRVGHRYARCISSGMSEVDAGICFADI